MNRKIKSINKKEVLKYLGQGKDFKGELYPVIEELSQELLSKVRPKVILNEYKLEGSRVAETTLTLQGEDINKLLETSQSVIIFAATLGIEGDNLISRYGKKDLYKSLIVDAVASVAVETLCEDLEYEIKVEKTEMGQYLTDRFSPGYGDMPINQNREICNILDTNRKIGLSTSRDGIMIPRKSVTALIGISNVKQKYRERGCGNCSMASHCSIRKRGMVCHA